MSLIIDHAYITDYTRQLYKAVGELSSESDKLEEKESIFKNLVSRLKQLNPSPRNPRSSQLFEKNIFSEIANNRDYIKKISKLLNLFFEWSIIKTKNIDPPKVLNDKDKIQKIIVIVNNGLKLLLHLKKFSIKYDGNRMYIENALKLIKKQSWFKNISKINVIKKELKNTIKESKKIRLDYFDEVKKTKVEYSKLNSKDEQLLKEVIFLKLVQKINPFANSSEQDKWSIISPKIFLATFRMYMTDLVMFKNIEFCLENKMLCLEQKRILINLCIKWLKENRNIDLLFQNDVAEQLKKIIKTAFNNMENKKKHEFQIVQKSINEELFSEDVEALEKLIKHIESQRFFTLKIQNLSSSSIITEPLPIPLNLQDSNFDKYSTKYREELFGLSCRFFLRIDPQEFLDYQKKNGEEHPKFCANLLAAINLFNCITCHIASLILLSDTIEKKDDVYLRFDFFSEVGLKCYIEGDFFTATAITGALDNPSISSVVKSYSREKYHQLSDLTSPLKNSAVMRKSMNDWKNKGMIPFLGIINKDVEFLLAGNSIQSVNFYDSPSIEFDISLLKKIYGFISDIKNCQTFLSQISFPPLSALQNIILSAPPYETIQDTLQVKKKKILEKENTPLTTYTNLGKSKSLGWLEHKVKKIT